VSAVARALGVSRTSLYAEPAPRSHQQRTGDAELLEAIKGVVKSKPSFGYRRVTAWLRKRGFQANHKRVYRLMSRAKLVLERFAPRPERPHDGKVITLRSDLRWCSDGFQIRCWNGERVHVVFSLDCCDREVISWVAANKDLAASDVRDLMAESIESRFNSTSTPHPIEWLSDNGPQFTANETRRFGIDCGLLVRNTPAYSPESNGMAEAFVKSFKRDFVYLADVRDAATVMKQLPGWFEEYNERHPHKGLKMLSPREYRRANPR
jgi:transposase InsO family protein